jgi:hypothetical protein
VSASGFAALDAQIARLRAIGSGFGKSAAPRVAAEAEKVWHVQLDAGQGPSGTPWKPTKTGERPLKNARNAATVSAIGTVLLFKVEGPEALHNDGRARGKIMRRMLPSRRLATPIVEAIKRVLGEEFEAAMGGTRGR